MDKVTLVADSGAAWKLGTRVCCYRADGMPDDQVMVCNRTEKGSVERCKVVDATPLVVGAAHSAPAVPGGKRRKSGKHSGSKRDATHRVTRKAKGIAPPSVACREFTVWTHTWRQGREYWKGTGVRLSYAAACMHACKLRDDGEAYRTRVLQVSSGRPDAELWTADTRVMSVTIKSEVDAIIESPSLGETLAKLRRDNANLRHRLHGGRSTCEICQVLLDETAPVAAEVVADIRRRLEAE
jgi:hypothetical protein